MTKALQRLVVLRVGRHPGGVDLGFLGGLGHVGDHPVGLDGPGPDERLVEQVLGVAVRLLLAPVAGVALRPSGHRGPPGARDLGQDVDTGPGVRPPFGVMGGQRQLGRGPARHRRAVVAVEAVDGAVHHVGAAADLVQRDQAVVPVEDRVLDALGHDRPAELLETGCELFLPGAGILQAQQGPEEVEQLGVDVAAAHLGLAHRTVDHLAVEFPHRMPGPHIGAVDREGGQHLAQPVAQLPPGVVPVPAVALGDRRQQVGQPVDLGGQLLAHDLELGLADEVGVLRRHTGELPVQRRELGQVVAGDEEPVDPVQELVARGAGDRPVLGKLLVRGQDLLDDHPDGAGGLVQPLQVARGVEQPVHVVDAQPVDQAADDQGDDHAVGVLEDLLVLDPQADEGLDVEEPAVVELLARRPPQRQPVILALQQGVEDVVVGVDRVHLGVDGGRHRRLGGDQMGQAVLEQPAAPVAFGGHVGLDDEGVGKAPESRRDAPPDRPS